MVQLVLRRFGFVSAVSGLRAIEVSDLKKIMGEAGGLKLSGKGRPDWVARNESKISRVVLSLVTVEKKPVDCYRCRVIVLLVGDLLAAQFLVDVLPWRFHAMRKLRPTEVAGLAADLMERVPHLPLDPDQVALW